jgi:hypothetical protein
MGVRARLVSPAGLLLIALLVAVISLVFGPALGRVCAATEQETCASNLRHLGLALRLYANDYDGYLPPHGQRAAAGGSPAEQAAFKAALTPYLPLRPAGFCLVLPGRSARPHPFRPR